MQQVIAPPTITEGLIKSFGSFGPRYEINKALYPLENGDWAVEITLVETGEKIEYSLKRLQEDPDAE
jgi:hypothetical protein